MRTRRARSTALLGALAVLTSASPAAAWKPVTHVHLAQVAWDDARDGKVTIYAVDHDTGRVGAPIGEYAVEPTVHKAIVAHEASFFAGLLGPDAYPDMMTGQMRIHPPGHGDPGDKNVNAGGAGPVPWFRQLWLAAHGGGALDEVAFAAGYLAHAAGDYYAHTYVNRYTGDIFNFDSDNGVKHMVLESYLGQRTPPLRPIRVAGAGSLDAYDAIGTRGLTPGVARLVARHLRDIGRPNEQNRTSSLPWYFHELRGVLEAAELGYRRHEASLRAGLGDIGAELALLHRARDWSCDVTRGAPCPIDGTPVERCPSPYKEGRAPNALACGIAVAAFELAFKPVAPALLPWRAFVDLYAPVAMHLRTHLRAIEEGLVRWVETNHRIAMAMLLARDGANLGAATEELKRFAPTLVSMTLGVDPKVTQLLDAIGAIRALRPPHPHEVITKIADGARDAGFRALLGATPEELVRQMAGAHAVLDTVFRAPIRRQVNADLGLAADAMTDIEHRGLANAERFAHARFAAAHNTVTLTKLALMAPGEVQRLYRDLAQRSGAPVPSFAATAGGGAPNNVLLTFGETLDGAHQWNHGFALAADCRAYKQIFAKVVGPPGKRIGNPGDPIDTCQPPRPLEVQVSGATVPSGGSATLKFAERVRLGLDGGGRIPQHCEERGGSCEATFVAPVTDVDLDVTITAVAAGPNADTRRTATARLRVLAPLALAARPIASASGLDVMAAAGTLTAGSRLVLDVQPPVPVRWTITGPGQLGDPARAAALEATRRTRAAAVTAAEAELVRARDALIACGQNATCVATARPRVEQAIARLRTASQELLDVQLELDELTRTYVAPARLTAPAAVAIRATTTDGRAAQLELEVRPAWPPLQLAAPIAAVPAGGSVELRVAPEVPMRWTVTRGGGSIAADGPRGAEVERELAPIRAAVGARPAAPTRAPSARRRARRACRPTPGGSPSCSRAPATAAPRSIGSPSSARPTSRRRTCSASPRSR